MSSCQSSVRSSSVYSLHTALAFRPHQKNEHFAGARAIQREGHRGKSAQFSSNIAALVRVQYHRLICSVVYTAQLQRPLLVRLLTPQMHTAGLRVV